MVNWLYDVYLSPLVLDVFDKFVEVRMKNDMLLFAALRRNEINNRAVTAIAATIDIVIHSLLLVLFACRSIFGGNKGVVTFIDELLAAAASIVGFISISS